MAHLVLDNYQLYTYLPHFADEIVVITDKARRLKTKQLSTCALTTILL